MPLTSGRCGFLVLILSICTMARAGGPPPLFHFSQDGGPYAVGLKVVEQYDYSRPYEGERARPMQTLVWYPAGAGTQRAMTVRDYADLWGSEVSFSQPEMPEAAKEWLAEMAPAVNDRLWAVRDAKPAQGRFPVVIYTPSFASVATPWENADLCEYLASHGYVVLASPNLGAAGSNMTADVSGIEAQARDISFLIGYAQTLINADASHTAVVGFSWGGIANLFAAARDDRIAALVALDGSMRYYPGLVRAAGYVHPERMTVPLLYFLQAHASIEDQDRYLTESQKNGPNVLNAWTHGDLITVRMLGFSHEEFGSMYQRNESTWREFFDLSSVGHQPADYDRADGSVGYGWVAQYTLAFLDAYIKHAVAAKAFLQRAPAENGVPKHVLWIERRPATPVATERP